MSIDSDRNVGITNTLESYRQLLIDKLCQDDPGWSEMIESTYGEDYRYDALGLHFGLAPFKVRTEELVILLKDTELVIPRWRADAQLLAYQAGADVFDHEERVYLIREGEDIIFDYTILRPVVRNEGQSKLFLGFVETLSEMEVSDETNVLCIGSAGDIGISGLSYEALIDVLAGVGHKGIMYMYDPNYKHDQVYNYLTYEVRILSKKYDYSYHCHRADGIKLVLEDVYVHNMSSTRPMSVTGVLQPVKNGRIPHGESIFVTYVSASGKTTIKAWKPGECPKHKNHGLEERRDFPNKVKRITGGGYIRRDGYDAYVNGSSLTYGPYDEQEVRNLLPGLNVYTAPVYHGRAAYDPGWTLFRAYAGARISTKYFGEDIPDVVKQKSRVSTQLMYDGREQRLLYNVPRYPDGFASCCQAHARLDGLGKSMRTVQNVDPSVILDQAYASVSRYHCSPYIGVGVLTIKQRLKAAAIQNLGLKDAVKNICVSLRVSTVKVHRVLNTMIRYKLVSIRCDTAAMFMTDFSRCVFSDVLGEKKCLFESDDKNKFYDPSDGKIYSWEGKELQAPTHNKAYLVREMGVVRTAEYGLHDVMAVLIKLKISWRTVLPFGLVGKGKFDVGVNCVGTDVILVSRSYTTEIRIGQSYSKLTKYRGFTVYFRKKLRKKK